MTTLDSAILYQVGTSPAHDGAEMKMHCITNPELTHFLKREQWATAHAYDLDLATIFRDILERANDFLPSEAGSIFLVDPVIEQDNPDQRELVVVACFGEKAPELVGLGLFADTGIAGHVYRSGQAYISGTPEEDPLFFHELDRSFGFRTRSVVCAPLRVERETIGVIELLNHRAERGYTQRDLQLLEIFAQTISASLANAIEAQRSKELAKRDDLTGLYNDRFLHHSLSQVITAALANDEDCALIFLDLDHFKSINDHHGHLIGSRVLSEVGATLRQILPGEAIAARYGGDEFVIVMPGAGRQEVLWVAETVRKNIEATVFLEEADADDPANYPALAIRGVITCSIGIATLTSDILPKLGPEPDPATAKNELMKVADASMYRAKESGRNQIVTSWKEPLRGLGSSR
jgi:diguanylate cyclase (GGDEF)-like protein